MCFFPWDYPCAYVTHSILLWLRLKITHHFCVDFCVCTIAKHTLSPTEHNYAAVYICIIDECTGHTLSPQTTEELLISEHYRLIKCKKKTSCKRLEIARKRIQKEILFHSVITLDFRYLFLVVVADRRAVCATFEVYFNFNQFFAFFVLSFRNLFY